MNDLKQAARQALKALENRFNPKVFDEMDKAIDALRQALEPKPCNMGQMCLDCQPRGANGECPDQQPKQEPVAYSCTSRITGTQTFSLHPKPPHFDSYSWDIKPLYIEPPKREWVGLTAADLAEIPANCYEGAIWADAKLKEKNT